MLKPIIAYKGFDKDLKCRDFQYKVGETYAIEDRPVACKRGFHACYKLLDINTYYPLKDSRVCIVEILGDIDTDTEEDVVCTNKILIVRELTQKEIADVLVEQDNYGTAILIFASRYGHTEVVEMILKAKADVNAKDKDGWTALIYASYYGYTEIVKLLIEAKADVNIKDNYETTALMFVSERGYKEVVKILIEAGADVNVKNDWEYTALMWASIHGYTEIVKMLLKAGADVNIKSKDGDNALIYAYRKGHEEVFKKLIKAGAK